MNAPDLTNLFLAYLAFGLMIISPGPNNLAVIAATVSGGRPAGTAVALGISSGSFTWAILTVAGLSAVLAQTAGALRFIKIAGGLYLFWLALKSLRSAAAGPVTAKSSASGDGHSGRSLYLRGYILQMTNPKAALTWIAINSVGLNAHAGWLSLVFLIGGTTTLAIVIHCSYAMLFSGQRVMQVFQRFHSWMHGFFAAFFGFAAFKLLTSRL